MTPEEREALEQIASRNDVAVLLKRLREDEQISLRLDRNLPANEVFEARR